jgi:hypothetical protein
MTTILDKGVRTQQDTQEKGADVISDKFFRGVKSSIRQEINKNFLAPEKIDMEGIKDKISKAMALAFLVSSGKIEQPQTPLNFASVEQFANGGLFNFDLPFSQALSLWEKNNPINKSLLDSVLGSTNIMANNSMAIMNQILSTGVDDILRTGKPIQEMVKDLSEVTDKGTSYFETALRTGVATAQNAGHMARMSTAPGIALWEFRSIKDDRTTGAPNGIYSGNKFKNPGFDFQLHGYKAPPDHAIWSSIYPPNHFNCRSKVVAISWSRATALGYTKQGKRELKEQYKNPAIPPYVQNGEWPAQGFDRSPMQTLGVGVGDIRQEVPSVEPVAKPKQKPISTKEKKQPKRKSVKPKVEPKQEIKKKATKPEKPKKKTLEDLKRELAEQKQKTADLQGSLNKEKQDVKKAKKETMRLEKQAKEKEALERELEIKEKKLKRAEKRLDTLRKLEGGK